MKFTDHQQALALLQASRDEGLVKAGADINESNGADINAKTDGKIGDSALTYAKIRGNTEVVKVLQAAGAK